MPEFKEIGEFFTQELRAQLRDANDDDLQARRAVKRRTAADSASIKRVLQKRR